DNLQTFRFEPPRFGDVQGDDARAGQGAAHDALPRVQIPDTMISPPMQVGPPVAPLPPPELPRFGAPLGPPRAALPTDMAIPFQPAWQRSLDRALAAVGRVGEAAVGRVRAQSRPMQIAIIGTLLLVVLLLIVLVTLLLYR